MIIDTRLRPPTPEFVRIMVEGPMTSTYFRKLQKTFPPRPTEEFLQEMDEAGIRYGVMPGRQAIQPFGRVSNEDIYELVDTYPERPRGRQYLWNH